MGGKGPEVTRGSPVHHLGQASWLVAINFRWKWFGQDTSTAKDLSGRGVHLLVTVKPASGWRIPVASQSLPREMLAIDTGSLFSLFYMEEQKLGI
ncbi:hypothetical protein I79_025896 [Cricetulus griseus]|uniref:Uncharacterized protein n=1 Tax=Cricetulus griseus TaxID=10029 RepID=G3IPI5_CRIGR|nr:hypothetical protein I79_025896 [Cricetulus griseus]